MSTDRRNGRVRRASWSAALVTWIVLPVTLAGLLQASAAPANDGPSSASDLGCGSAEVTYTLATGSAWRMCARVHRFKGLVLEQVQFKPATGSREYQGWMPVIDSLYLAQLVVPYDTGDFAFADITDFGFGDRALLPQTDVTCRGETLAIQQSYMVGPQQVDRTIPGVCVDEVDTGLGWHGREESYRDDAARYSQRGRALEVSSLSKVSWYEYQQKITLTDQGEITVGLGATGDLAPEAYVDDPATTSQVGPQHDEGEDPAHGQSPSHWHNAVYRVDFGIGTGDQQVEQWDYSRPDPTNAPGRVAGTSQIRTEAFTADPDPDPQTWWRVLNPTSLNADGHPRSYEIVNDSIQNPYDPVTRPQVSFTNNHACQEYASLNLNAGCPNQSLLDYVAQETDPLTDPVAWVNVGFHHIARDEDQSPMPVHWQSFSLAPRNLLSQQATTPIERSCVNGVPLTLYGSCAAINSTAPVVNPSARPVIPGTTLSATEGTWKPTRGVLSYQRLWLRDGKPITFTGANGLQLTATGLQYKVTNADRGHRISVRIIASTTGVVPGSADSAALSVASVPPSTAPPRPNPKQASTLRVRVTGSKQRVLRVRVVGGSATGTITVTRGTWKRTAKVRNSSSRVRLPRAWRHKTVWANVSYSGDSRHRSKKVAFRIQRMARR